MPFIKLFQKCLWWRSFSLLKVSHYMTRSLPHLVCFFKLHLALKYNGTHNTSNMNISNMLSLWGLSCSTDKTIVIFQHFWLICTLPPDILLCWILETIFGMEVSCVSIMYNITNRIFYFINISLALQPLLSLAQSLSDRSGQ